MEIAASPKRINITAIADSVAPDEMGRNESSTDISVIPHAARTPEGIAARPRFPATKPHIAKVSTDEKYPSAEMIPLPNPQMRAIREKISADVISHASPAPQAMAAL